jgi:hypothetical protein
LAKKARGHSWLYDFSWKKKLHEIFSQLISPRQFCGF